MELWELGCTLVCKPMAAPRITFPHDELAALCRRWKVRRLSLFGSVLRDDFGPESDVDVLLEFESGGVPTLFTFEDLRRELSRLFGGRRGQVNHCGSTNLPYCGFWDIMPPDLEGDRLVIEGLALVLNHQDLVLAVGYGPRAYLDAIDPSGNCGPFRYRYTVLGNTAHKHIGRLLGEGHGGKRHNRYHYSDQAPNSYITHGLHSLVRLDWSIPVPLQSRKPR